MISTDTVRYCVQFTVYGENRVSSESITIRVGYEKGDARTGTQLNVSMSPLLRVPPSEPQLYPFPRYK